MKAPPFNVMARSVGLKATAIAQTGGGTSKLVLESQSAEQEEVHDRIYSPLDKGGMTRDHPFANTPSGQHPLPRSG